MGCPDICCRFLQRQVLVVDILCPVVTDPLLPFQVVSRHPFHGNRLVDKMLHLVPVVFFSLIVGIQRNEGQHGNHQGYVRHDNPRCLQTVHFSSSFGSEIMI